MEDIKVIIVKVNKEKYGLDINHVISIEKMQSCTALPSTPNYVRGIIPIRGIVTPIIDLGIALGHSEKVDTDTTRIVLISIEGSPIGLVVDEATDVLDISTDSIQQVSIMKQVDFIQGVSKIENRMLVLIDVHKMLENIEGLKELKNVNFNQSEVTS
ncbi:chemotaxis protein CheW [Peribacillus kribbensis]|uniref:chemotaxis protein CheW n=1 Tax=Peribacillus kribbensis TaxID=356658 RepID=UPI000403883A|nr:chemotaxis protein CheW [Peribacillus kribbensis]